MKNLFRLFFALSPTLIFGQLNDHFNIATSPTLANPAYTGVNNYGAINLNSLIFSEDMHETNIGYQTHLPTMNSGVGIVLGQGYYYGTDSKIIGLVYSYQTKVSKKLTLSSGVSGRITSIKYDYTPGYNKNYSSLNGGLMLFGERFFVSIGVADIRFDYDYYSVTGNIGYSFKFKKVKDLIITPTIGLSASGKFWSNSLRLNFSYKMFKVLIGTNTRDILAGLGFEHNRWMIQYMPIYSTSSLSNSNALQHRISLQLKLPKAIKRSTNSFDFSLF